jgi:hypothetical protein
VKQNVQKHFKNNSLHEHFAIKTKHAFTRLYYSWVDNSGLALVSATTQSALSPAGGLGNNRCPHAVGRAP